MGSKRSHSLGSRSGKMSGRDDKENELYLPKHGRYSHRELHDVSEKFRIQSHSTINNRELKDDRRGNDQRG